tara:strand:+ start:18536 stop:18679 length:144 start_codon:yes stop_codon:yes gene_type:complete
MYIIYYKNDKDKDNVIRFENKEFMRFWFKKYIHTEIYKMTDKVEINY